MVSDPIQVSGQDGTGAGPVQLDLAEARPNSTYGVTYVPSSAPQRAIGLGEIKTDARGTFTGLTAELMPPLDAAARTGVLVLTRR